VPLEDAIFALFAVRIRYGALTETPELFPQASTYCRRVIDSLRDLHKVPKISTNDIIPGT